MQGAVRLLIVVGVASAGCGSSPLAAPPDGPGSSAAGLSIPWTVTPAVPGSITSTIAITDLIFRVESLRVVGDAGTSASVGDVTLEWKQGLAPAPTMFEDAPSGLYSKIAFHADGDQSEYSWEIDGNVQLSGTTYPFEIHDRDDLDVDIDTSATLQPGGIATLGVQVDIAQPFAGLDFTKLDMDGGTLELDTDDSAMSDFRDKLSDAIVAAPDTASE